MTEALIAAVFCLAATAAVLAIALSASMPFLYWRCFRFEARLDKVKDDMQSQINVLDDALSRFMRAAGVPEEKQE